MAGNSHGQIVLITGCMFSGKTEELIRRIVAARTAGLTFQVFCPKTDTRSGDNQDHPRIRSHSGLSMDAVAVQSPSEILTLLVDQCAVVAIDEIQFFDPTLVFRVILDLVALEKQVIVSGLDRNFRGEPFEIVNDLVDLVRVERLRARCAVCGQPADLTQRLIDGRPAPYNSPLIMIGGSELYEPRCFRHHVTDLADDRKTKRTSRENGNSFQAVDIREHLDWWADRLQATARTGLGYNLTNEGQDRYFDQERYEDILKLAAEMRAFVLNRETLFEQYLPRDFYAIWRAQVGQGHQSYVTPRVTASAAVFNQHDEILLVRRKAPSFWDLPGGWCDVGYSPAEVATKEVREEAGIQVTPLYLVGIYDSRRWGFLSPSQLYCLVFYCHNDGGELRPDDIEVQQIGFFHELFLPPLLPGVQASIEHAFSFHRGERRDSYYDIDDR